jgi:hypothetical protein
MIGVDPLIDAMMQLCLKSAWAVRRDERLPLEPVRCAANLRENLV